MSLPWGCDTCVVMCREPFPCLQLGNAPLQFEEEEQPFLETGASASHRGGGGSQVTSFGDRWMVCPCVHAPPNLPSPCWCQNTWMMWACRSRPVPPRVRAARGPHSILLAEGHAQEPLGHWVRPRGQDTLTGLAFSQDCSAQDRRRALEPPVPRGARSACHGWGCGPPQPPPRPAHQAHSPQGGPQAAAPCCKHCIRCPRCPRWALEATPALTTGLRAHLQRQRQALGLAV